MNRNRTFDVSIEPGPKRKASLDTRRRRIRADGAKGRVITVGKTAKDAARESEWRLAEVRGEVPADAVSALRMSAGSTTARMPFPGITWVEVCRRGRHPALRLALGPTRPSRSMGR
jgi:hypothetical protein